ncbi:MAG: FHA domain-containing protein [Acidimicrobiia bacterium]|nr:FHA domain-containing protein [Acidimicrobiia bacterium]
MTEFLLTALRFIFLALIYLFVWYLARALVDYLGLRLPTGVSRRSSRLVFVRSESQAGMHFAVADSVVLGKSPDADVPIDDPYASEFHLRITRRRGKLSASDLGSANGTYLNGRKLRNPVELARGDAIQVGRTVLEVR